MYDYTDIIIHYLERQFIKRFRRLKSILSIDEISVMEVVGDIYADCYELIRKMYVQLAVHAYREYAEKSDQIPDFYWLDVLLNDYDPVAKYIFTREIERKKSRLAEAILAGGKPDKEAETAIRLLSFMVREFAVRVTDEAVMKAYRDDGVKYARWIAEHDNRVCDICLDRDGKVYPLASFPVKPHYGCRCTRERAEANEKRK